MVGSVIDEVAGLKAASTKQTTIYDYAPQRCHLWNWNCLLVLQVLNSTRGDAYAT